MGYNYVGEQLDPSTGSDLEISVFFVVVSIGPKMSRYAIFAHNRCPEVTTLNSFIAG